MLEIKGLSRSHRAASSCGVVYFRVFLTRHPTALNLRRCKSLRCGLHSRPLVPILLSLGSAFSSLYLRACFRLPGRLVLRVAGDRRHAVDELGLEENVSVVEHAILERDHDELRVSEVGAQHLADVLGVRKIQRRVNFVQNVQRRGFEQKHREDQRQGYQRPAKTSPLKFKKLFTKK